jgi:glycosyltransferase involved in cell wall biosynthesis
LTVYNVENTLAQKVSELLEVVAELTSDLEILVVDNGSTDNTEEVAMELRRRFPQIEILRQASHSTEIEAVRAGIAKTTGDVVLVHDIDFSLSGDSIQKFWAIRNDKGHVLARSDSAHTNRFLTFGQDTNPARLGTQVVRRETVDTLRESQASTKSDRATRADLGAPHSILRKSTESRPIELDK